MTFARKVWHLLVAIKDGLVLLLLLLFFTGLYGLLTMRPSAGTVQDGALLLRLNGSVVEEPAVVDPVAILLSGSSPASQYRARDIVRAIQTAATDSRMKAVVLDLSGFGGAGQVHLAEIGASMDKVRASGKPVLTYSTAYEDAGVLLAAHASEAWIHPLGMAFVAGPGGNNPYFAGLAERFKVNVHVYRVGTYKEFVEPYVRDSMSEPARQARQAVLDNLFADWKANVAAARPKANIALVTQDPAGWIKAAGGNGAEAARAAGLVDRIGDRASFAARMRQLVGPDRTDKGASAFAHTSLKTWLAANPVSTSGKRIGVITIAGDIVDGDAGPGIAGGDRIVALLDSAPARELAGLVVRVDSPGGSVLASEEIRSAVSRIKARGVPVAVSMGNMAASGGYWVSTPGLRIFAEPATITGSIGIFAVLPSFEKTLASYGVTSDGVTTTKLSGQPDVVGGFTPEVEALLQSSIEGGYARFIGLVAQARGRTPAQIDAIAQGRIWDGGAARQNGLVDQFGSLDDALAWTAKKAGLGQGDWSPLYLGDNANPYASLLEKFAGNDDSAAPDADIFARIAARQRQSLGRALAGAERLLSAGGAQAYCMGCPEQPAAPAAADRTLTGWLAALRAWIG